MNIVESFIDIKVKTYLIDIYHSISEIENYFSEKPQPHQKYIADIRTKRAVERNIEIIGEAINRILKADASFEIHSAREIVDVKNHLTDNYYKISDDMVWDIVINHLPKLKEQIEKVFEKKDEKTELLCEIKEAVQELNLIKQGKAQGRPAKDMLNEL